MNADLRDLYQDLILDHGKKPRNFHTMPDAQVHAEGFNPLCGDKCTVYANLTDGTLTDVSFQGKGCAISQASASLMTQIVKDKPRAEIQHYFEIFQKMVKDTATPAEIEELGKLAALAGVKEFPSRVKCATLPWHTLIAALDQKPEIISTE